jgi:hypothetical protein
VGFKEDLAAAKASVDAGDRVKTEVIPVAVNSALYEFVFYRSASADWARDTLKHPPREQVAVDLRNGYNLTGVTREVAPSTGRLLEDGAEVVLSAEEWADLWAVIPGASARLIEANVWQLNENDPVQEIARLKKASLVASRKKRS